MGANMPAGRQHLQLGRRKLPFTPVSVNMWDGLIASEFWYRIKFFTATDFMVYTRNVTEPYDICDASLSDPDTLNCISSSGTPGVATTTMRNGCPELYIAIRLLPCGATPCVF